MASLLFLHGGHEHGHPTGGGAGGARGSDDPEARGKMERFWRTLREGCLNDLGAVASLEDINVTLRAHLDTRYHPAPHAGLLGKSPAKVYDRSLYSRIERRLAIGPMVVDDTAEYVQMRLRRAGADREVLMAIALSIAPAPPQMAIRQADHDAISQLERQQPETARTGAESIVTPTLRLAQPGCTFPRRPTRCRNVCSSEPDGGPRVTT